MWQQEQYKCVLAWIRSRAVESEVLSSNSREFRLSDFDSDFQLYYLLKVIYNSFQMSPQTVLALSKNTETCFKTMYMQIHLSLLQNMIKQELVFYFCRKMPI